MIRRRSAVHLLAAVVLCVAAFSGFELAAQDHLGQYAQSDIVRGSQVYAAQCAACHGPNGNNIGTVNLALGRFRLAASDDDLKRLIQTGIPSAGMPPISLDAGELTAIVAYIRSGLDVNARAVTVAVGDAGRGRAIFEGKGACSRCHRVGGEGSAAAPDLTDIGSLRSPAALQLTLVDPNGAMLPLNRPIRAVTRDGTTIRGRRLNEDTYTVQLIDERERLMTLEKAELRQYEIIKVSPMPSYRDELTKDELADLLAYLVSLKG
jgi:putative heme-binding domain-containing protein